MVKNYLLQASLTHLSLSSETDEMPKLYKTQNQIQGKINSNLIEWFEFDVLGRQGIIQKWSLNGVKIMCSYSNKASSSAQVMMKLILKINEAVITGLETEYETIETVIDIDTVAGFHTASELWSGKGNTGCDWNMACQVTVITCVVKLW